MGFVLPSYKEDGRRLKTEIHAGSSEVHGLSPTAQGVVVTDTFAAVGPQDAGLQVGDVIQEVNRQTVRSVDARDHRIKMWGVEKLYWSQARSGCCPWKKLLTASTRT